MVLDLGSGKQLVVSAGRIMIWANRGCLGVEMTLDQQEDVGLAMYRMARKAKRDARRECGAG